MPTKGRFAPARGPYHCRACVTLAAKLRDREWSQAQLAEELARATLAGTNQSTVSRVLRGLEAPNRLLVDALHAVLGIDPLEWYTRAQVEAIRRARARRTRGVRSAETARAASAS